jgi:branched-subunit amino acid ABC-type transport system permease component
VAAGLTALVVWVVTVLTRSGDAWSAAPVLVAGLAAIVAVLTYLAERIVYRRSMERKRATGEPWAYRED